MEIDKVLVRIDAMHYSDSMFNYRSVKTLVPLLTASIAAHIDSFVHSLCFFITSDTINAGAECERGLPCDFRFRLLAFTVTKLISTDAASASSLRALEKSLSKHHDDSGI